MDQHRTPYIGRCMLVVHTLWTGTEHRTLGGACWWCTHCGPARNTVHWAVHVGGAHIVDRHGTPYIGRCMLVVHTLWTGTEHRTLGGACWWCTHCGPARNTVVDWARFVCGTQVVICYSSLPDQLRQYFTQLRQELGARIVEKVYASGEKPSKVRDM